jgi:hypothetical protein
MRALTPMRLCVSAIAMSVLACSPRPSSPDATSADRTALRPNDAGVVLPIGAPCKPEDGWQYVYPPNWPTVPPDSGAPTTVPIPPDYKETHQLEPGIGYCVTHLQTYPDGFFTSNCRVDSDCPTGAGCDGSWCNVPCAQDGDCRRGLYCPENPGRARFCRQGCPDPMPTQGYSCYTYGGPHVCAYPSASGSRTICRCAPKPFNDAVWECTPESQCPPSAPGESPCKTLTPSPLTCSYGSTSCRCEAGQFACSPGSSPDAGTATATTEAGVPDSATNAMAQSCTPGPGCSPGVGATCGSGCCRYGEWCDQSATMPTCRCGNGGACADGLTCCPTALNGCGGACVAGSCR